MKWNESNQKRIKDSCCLVYYPPASVPIPWISIFLSKSNLSHPCTWYIGPEISPILPPSQIFLAILREPSPLNSFCLNKLLVHIFFWMKGSMTQSLAPIVSFYALSALTDYFIVAWIISLPDSESQDSSYQLLPATFKVIVSNKT